MAWLAASLSTRDSSSVPHRVRVLPSAADAAAELSVISALIIAASCLLGGAGGISTRGFFARELAKLLASERPLLGALQKKKACDGNGERINMRQHVPVTRVGF